MEDKALCSPTVAVSVIINFLQPRCFSPSTPPTRAYSHVLSCEHSKNPKSWGFFSPLSLFRTRLLQRCPWVRDILCLLLTSLMIGKVLKSDSAHLFPPLRRCKGSTSLTSLPSGIDHLMILKYSQHPHNNKKHIGELFAQYLSYCKGLVESSKLPKCPEAETWSDSNSSDSRWCACVCERALYNVGIIPCRKMNWIQGFFFFTASQKFRKCEKNMSGDE